jgi:hypothetical protein
MSKILENLHLALATGVILTVVVAFVGPMIAG